MLPLALVFYSMVDFRAIVINIMGFQGNGCIFNLETKRVLLVALLFNLKVDFHVFHTKTWIFRARVHVRFYNVFEILKSTCE